MKPLTHTLSFAILSMFSILSLSPLLQGAPVVYRGTFGQRKAIAVPRAPAVATIDDFVIFTNGKPAVPEKKPASTRVELSRDDGKLMIHIHAEEPLKVRDGNRTDNQNLWSGDVFEIFFGGFSPSPWCAQFAIGAGGGRFSDFLRLDEWKATARGLTGGFELDIELPIAAFAEEQGGIGFNICRTRREAREYSVWSQMFYGFHEPENFGEILLDDYPSIFQRRYGKSGAAITTRTAFEKASAECAVPATAFRSVPRLLHPDQHAMTVSWESMGGCFGKVEFRQKGTEAFQEVIGDVKNGLAAVTQFHKVHLSGLRPGTIYEYRVVNIHSVNRQPQASPLYHFRTVPDQPESLTAFIICDPHANHEVLKKLLQHTPAKEADWIINLGDMHSAWNGPETLQRGFLMTETAFLGGLKPITMLRGNHECRGNSSALFDSWLDTPDHRSYRLLRWGDIAFILLDTGDPQSDFFGCQQKFLDEQREWLKTALHSPEYTTAAKRLILCHIPPWDERMISAFFNGILTAPGVIAPDVMLCGHVHRSQIRPASPQIPCPIHVGYGALLLEIRDGKMKISAYDWNGHPIPSRIQVDR